MPAAIVLSPTQVTLKSIGDTLRITAAVKDQNGQTLSGSVSWTTGDGAVATVSDDGLVRAVGNGTTSITATVGSVSGSASATVRQEAKQVSVTPATLSMTAPGEIAQLAVSATDSGGAAMVNPSVAWTSSNEAVATVALNGTVTAVANGSATITATVGSAKGTAAVTVGQGVAQVRITSPSTEVNEGTVVQLTLEVTDNAGAPVVGRPVTWVSDSAQFATVDATGLVRTVRAGLARIRAQVDGVEGVLDLPIRGLLYRWTFEEVGGPGTVFRDDLRGAQAVIVAGGSPASAAAGQVTLTGGARQSADYVALPAGLLRNRADATIEVWATLHSLKSWSRVFDVGSGMTNNLFIAWSQGTSPGTDRTGFSVNGVEHRLDNVLAPFNIDIQHHIVLSVDEGGGPGGTTRVSLYLDGAPRGSFNTPYRLRDLVDNDFWLGRSHYQDETANASYDEVRIHDRVYADAEVQQLFLTGPVRSSPPVSITIATPAGIRDTVRGVGVRFNLRAVGRDALGRQFPVAGAQWSTGNASVATIDNAGTVQTLTPGRVDVTMTVSGATARWTADVVRVRRLAVDPYLGTPLPGALWEVPVVLIEYLPTADASNLDVRKAPDFWYLGPMSLDSAEARVLTFARRRKMMVEQGSRFRGYRDAAALPSLGYRVVEHIIVYDQIPPHPTKRATFIQGQPPYEGWHEVFADLQLAPLMLARGVRELWVAWSGFDAGFPSYDPAIHKAEDMRYGAESNMASPTTGDISNSDRDPNDLPLLSHTYIVYGIAIRRTQAEAVHNVGHQLESMLSYVASRQDGNDFLFWRNFAGFVGQAHPLDPGLGRAGWTHMPPNTTTGYDYTNSALVSSDIEDWRPDNSGQKKLVNVDTWGRLTYPWPGQADFEQRVESQWYTYWFQNFPGRGNAIPHGTSWMTNWWAFAANWDAAITSGLGLYASTPAAGPGVAASYAYPAPPRPTAVPRPHLPRPPRAVRR